MSQDRILNAKEVSEYLGIGQTHTYELFHSKGFPCFKVGKGALRVKLSKLNAWIEKMENEYERQ